MLQDLVGAEVLGHMRPTSVASEAVSWYVQFGIPKNHRRKHFSRSWLKSKVAQWSRFRSTGRPQIRPPRPPEAIRGQNHNFTQFEEWTLLYISRSHLGSLEADLWGRSRQFEAVFLKRCIWHFFIMSGRIEAIWGSFLKKLHLTHLTLFHHIGANWGGDGGGDEGGRQG